MSLREECNIGVGPKAEVLSVGRRPARRHLRAAVVRGVLAAFLSCGLAGRLAAATVILLDPNGFTAYVAAQIEATIPDDKVEIVSPLRLRIASPRGGWGAYLDTVFDACRRYHAGCADAVADFVKDMSTAFETPRPPRDRAALRVVVRPSDYVESMQVQLPGDKPLAVPLQGDLWMIGVFDLPTSIDLLTERSLPDLHLSPDEALAIGKQNMRADMRDKIREVSAKPKKGVVLMTGDPYEASLFAFPDLWAPLAGIMGGDLLVVVPASDVVLFEDGRTPHAAEIVAETAQFVMTRANRPFSADVFRWSPTGWTLLPAPGDTHP